MITSKQMEELIPFVDYMKSQNIDPTKYSVEELYNLHKEIAKILETNK